MCVCLSEAEQIHKAHKFAERLAGEESVNSQSVSSGSGSRLAVWRIATAVASVLLYVHTNHQAYWGRTRGPLSRVLVNADDRDRDQQQALLVWSSGAGRAGGSGSELAARVCRELQRAPRFMSSRRVHALPPSLAVCLVFIHR